MKYIFALVIFIAWFGVAFNNVSAKETVSWEILWIQKKVWTQYQANWAWYIQYYNIANLEEDIRKDISDFNQWTMDSYNSIQLASKSKDWSKERFLKFSEYMKKKNTTQAALLIEKYWNSLDPFYARGDYLWIPRFVVAAKWLKNWIVTISGWWNGEYSSFRLNYIFIKDNIFYIVSSKEIAGIYTYTDFATDSQIKNPTHIVFQCSKYPNFTYYNLAWFLNEIKKNADCKILFDSRKSQISWWSATVGKYLKNPSLNKAFLSSYNAFIGDMNKLWK